MKSIKFLALALTFVSGTAFAGEVAYKYKINTFFGIKESCEVDGQDSLSQVRFYFDSNDLKSSKDLVTAEIRLSVCTITGGVIKEKHDLMIPRFLFVEAAPMQGSFPIKHPKFSKISVNELKRDQYQVRFFEKSGQAWSQIDPIEMTVNPKTHRTESLRFYVKPRKLWMEAKLR